MLDIPGKYTTARIMTDEIDEATVSQIVQMVNHPAFTEPVAIMPDCHAGAGCVIGFTMPLTEQIVPNVVGVDIGCGMLAAKISGTPISDLAKLDRDIRNKIPFGESVRQRSPQATYELVEGDQFFQEVNSKLNAFWVQLRNKFGVGVPKPPTVSYQWYMDKCKDIGMDFSRAQASLGTLGGGNHFIEIGIATSENPDPQSPVRTVENTWIVVHSGSRQFGKMICDYHQGKARQQSDEFKKGEYQDEVQQILRDTPPTQTQKALKALKERHASKMKFPKGMEPLTGRAAYNYMYDMIFAQMYASRNRKAIMTDIFKIVIPEPKTRTRPWHLVQPAHPPLEEIETVHNYIDPDDLIIRKGAVASRQGEKLVIPFNMKDGTWICIGQSDPIWNNSAPHGAGRIMSRSKAKELLNKEDVEKEMDGIYTSVIPIDEAPGAYKDAAKIKAAIGATAAVREEVKPILNMKAK